MDLKLVEIDLSNTTREGGSGLVVGPIYLCLIGGKYFCGKFDKQ